jgi:glycosyltransferase involved in cell wall biosynthesis
MWSDRPGMIADLITVYTVLSCGVWALAFIDFMRALKTVPLLGEDLRTLGTTAEKWPSLSIIVPACNEAVHIESAISSILTQDYPNLEIIAVNDRSTDATGDILNRMAATDSRLQVLHIRDLPAGWLGKVNAMHQGVQRAKGEWLLFTDADVHYRPGALRRAIIYTQHHGVDHLALVPRVITRGFWLEVAVRAFGLLLLLSARACKVNTPKSKTPFGVGAFNLVQANVFNKTLGFEWLRLEPGDDYGLGIMINNVGGRTRLAFADNDLSVIWYENVGAMFKGLEKNMFGPGAHYKWWRMLAAVFGLWAVVAAPWVGLIAGTMTGSRLMLGAAVVAIAVHIVFSVLYIREKRSETLSLLLFPVGVLMFTGMVLQSGFKCLRNRGIDWRGTHYSIDDLRAGQRVKF